MKKKTGKRCYYCGKSATSGEHAPPRQMFKAFLCDSLTVPSCEEHNSKKGGRDQAVVSAFLIPLQLGRQQYPLEPEIEQAVNIALPSFERAKRSAIRTALLKNPPVGLENLPDLSYLAPSVNMHEWIRQLTAAILASGIDLASASLRWSRSIVWSPNWLPAVSPAPIEPTQAVKLIEKNQEIHRALENLPWQNGWSAHPKPYPSAIYSFQIHIWPDKQILIRHKFYNTYTWYVQVRAAKSISTKLQKKLGEIGQKKVTTFSNQRA